MTTIQQPTFENRTTPWHGIGTVVLDTQSAQEAIERAGLDWEVEKREVCVDGEPLKHKVALCRSTDNEFYEIVSPSYNVLQNKTAFKIADEIIRIADEEVHYETAGSLFNGKKVFLTCEFGNEMKVVGDPFKTYLLLSNTHNGRSAVHMAITPVRVACWNTIQVALSRAQAHYAVPHYSTMEERVAYATAALRKTHEYMALFGEFGARAAEKHVSPAEVEALVEKLFPERPECGERHIKYRQSRIDIFERCLKAPDLTQFKGTAWGIINAISDYETHFAGRNRQRILSTILSQEGAMYKQALEFLTTL